MPTFLTPSRHVAIAVIGMIVRNESDGHRARLILLYCLIIHVDPSSLYFPQHCWQSLALFPQLIKADTILKQNLNRTKTTCSYFLHCSSQQVFSETRHVRSSEPRHYFEQKYFHMVFSQPGEALWTDSSNESNS